MNTRLVFALTLLASGVALAADLPAIPAESIAKKKELLFSDDFQGAEPAAVWHKVVPTFAVENGALKGTQTRLKNIVAPDGKSTNTAHAAVHGLMIPTKDSVVEVRVRLDGASLVDVEFDDRAYTNAHYGHLCRAILRTNGVSIMDEREGSQNMEIKALRNDPTKKEEVTKRMAGKQVTYPGSYEQNKWYTLVVETVGDQMRVTVDGKPAAYLKSPGIGHPTKSKIEFGVSGQSGLFDDIKVWNAAAAGP